MYWPDAGSLQSRTSRWRLRVGFSHVVVWQAFCVDYENVRSEHQCHACALVEVVSGSAVDDIREHRGSRWAVFHCDLSCPWNERKLSISCCIGVEEIFMGSTAHPALVTAV